MLIPAIIIYADFKEPAGITATQNFNDVAWCDQKVFMPYTALDA